MMTKAKCDTMMTKGAGYCSVVGGKAKATACDANGAYCTQQSESAIGSTGGWPCTADADCTKLGCCSVRKSVLKWERSLGGEA